jgi:hypothetical protein
MTDKAKRRADGVRLLASVFGNRIAKPGRGRPAKLERDLDVCLRLAELRSDGYKKIAAIKQAAAENDDLGESVVEEIYRRWLAGATFPKVANGYSMVPPKIGRKRRQAAKK